MFMALLNGSQRFEREIRLRRKYTPPIEGAEECSAWIKVFNFPLFEEDGTTVKLVLSYVLDVSHQKWTESVQARVAAAALLAKRQQEVSEFAHPLQGCITTNAFKGIH